MESLPRRVEAFEGRRANTSGSIVYLQFQKAESDVFFVKLNTPIGNQSVIDSFLFTL